MSHNPLSLKVADLLVLAEQMARRLESHGLEGGMPENVSATEIRQITDRVRQTEAAWIATKKAKASVQTRMTAADRALSTWLAKARLVVMLARGPKWSEGWIETGFEHRATTVPRRMELKISLARRLVVFLALHPDFAVPFADVTAAAGRPLYERIIQTRAALELAVIDCLNRKQERDAALGTLRCIMRQLQIAQRSLANAALLPSAPIPLKPDVTPHCLKTVAA